MNTGVAPFLNEIQRFESARLIQEAVLAQCMAESLRQEWRCTEALRLTPRDRWGHLEQVDDGQIMTGFGEPVWPSLACSWPDPHPGSRMADLARLSVGEG